MTLKISQEEFSAAELALEELADCIDTLQDDDASDDEVQRAHELAVGRMVLAMLLERACIAHRPG